MMNAGVSVIVCVRNGDAYLREALDSIAVQGVGELETIVIDDGSEDCSAEIARAHAVRPRVISRPASGHPASLNAGVEAASNAFVAILDADDVWPANRLRDMLRPFKSDPTLEIVSGQMVNTNALLEPKQAPFATRQLTCSLLRHGVFAKVDRFRTDVQHASTLDWMSRLAALKISRAEVESVVLLRRIHGENMGVRDAVRSRQDLLRVVREHHSRSKNA